MNKKNIFLYGLILFLLFNTKKNIYDINEYAQFKPNDQKFILKEIEKYIKKEKLKTLVVEPKVTIVTVVRNIIKEGRKEMLIKNFESVHNQNYKNIEHLVIDGASNDGTLEILEEYKNKNWITYISEPDNGIYDAMNKGIDLANGKYINFLNSDDFFTDKNAILISISAIEENNADFSFAANEIKKKFKSKIYIYTPNEKNIVFGGFFCHQTMFTTKKAMLEMGKFNTKLKVAADMDLTLKLLANNYKYVNLSPHVIISFNDGGFMYYNYEIMLSNLAYSFKNIYKTKIHLSSEQIHEMLICKNINKSIYLNILDFYKEKNPSFFEKIKDIYEYRPLYNYKLFNYIPIIGSYINGNIYNYRQQTRLFGFIPIIIKNVISSCPENNITIKIKTKLFDFIPLI